MTVYAALLRAINVGGTGILPMKDLTVLCTGLGFEKSRTHIQSGNVVFISSLDEATVRAMLETALAARLGKPVDVAVRTAGELRSILAANPFPAADPAKVAVAFRATPLPEGILAGFTAPGGEEIHCGAREVYIHYPAGMGRSKLKMPSALAPATARNINTVAKLVAMAENLIATG